MVAGSTVEEHPAAFVQGFESDPVLFVHCLLLERDVIAVIIPCTEPLRLARSYDHILVPHPEAKLVDRGEASLVTFILRWKLVVELGKEDRLVIVTVEVPPGTEVFRRGTPVLHDRQAGQVAEDVVGERTPPYRALLVNANAVMGSTESEKDVDVEVSTPFDHSTCDESTL